MGQRITSRGRRQSKPSAWQWTWASNTSPCHPNPQHKPSSSACSGEGFLPLASWAPLAGVRRGPQAVCQLLARPPAPYTTATTTQSLTIIMCLEVLGTNNAMPLPWVTSAHPKASEVPTSPLIPLWSRAATHRPYSSPPQRFPFPFPGSVYPPTLCPPSLLCLHSM